MYKFIGYVVKVEGDRIVHFSSNKNGALEFCKANGLSQNNMSQVYEHKPLIDWVKGEAYLGLYEPNEKNLLVPAKEEPKIQEDSTQQETTEKS